MSVIVTEDCVQRPDGTYICWDRYDGGFYQFSKKKLSEKDLSKEELSALIQVVGRPRNAENGN